MPCDFDRFIERRGTDSVKWHHCQDDVLPMWVADMDFRSPEPVIRALHERVEHGVFGYPTPPPELFEVIVERLERLYGWKVSPDALYFLPGVVTGLNLACHAFGSPGEGALIQTPVYGPFLYAPSHAGLICEQMPLTRQTDGYYTVDWDIFERSITPRTRLFLLCSPHNPVGRVFTRQELTRMAEICQAHDLLICSDEIHGDLVFRGHPQIPIASLSPEIEARTVTLIAPSKTFNIAGLHCSIAIIPNPDLRRRFTSATKGLVPGISLLSYVAGLAAYRDGGPWLQELLCYLEANRDLLVERVAHELPGVQMATPEGTYLAWLDCRQANLGERPSQFFLQQARVLLSDGTGYGPGGEGFVRFNFGCPRSMLTEALDRMAEALRNR